MPRNSRPSCDRAEALQAVELEPLASAGALACPRCSKESVLAYQAGDAYVSQCEQCGGVYVDDADLRALVGQRRRPKPDTDDAGLDGWWLGDALATAGPVVHAAAQRAIHIVWQAGAGLLEGL